LFWRPRSFGEWRGGVVNVPVQHPNLIAVKVVEEVAVVVVMNEDFDSFAK
jgi:hypothetical protein